MAIITNSPGNPSKTRNNHNPMEMLSSFGEDNRTETRIDKRG